MEYVSFDRACNTDLNMYQCGIEDCDPGHDYGPAVRDHFLIHYIRSGKGFFQVQGKTYHLCKGQGFLICPGVITYYKADVHDPWHYSWVGFHGLKAESYLLQANLTQENPIFQYGSDDVIKDYLARMVAVKKLADGGETRLLGLLYLFLSKLIEINGTGRYFDSDINRKEVYIKKAIEFIEMNYSRKISITEMAHYIGLDRSYLGSLFKSYLNTSPQEFLLNFRISKACELLKDNYLSVGDVSRSVGYEDTLLFSKVFKKVKGLPPRQFRRQL